MPFGRVSRAWTTLKALSPAWLFTRTGRCSCRVARVRYAQFTALWELGHLFQYLVQIRQERDLLAFTNERRRFHQLIHGPSAEAWRVMRYRAILVPGVQSCVDRLSVGEGARAAYGCDSRFCVQRISLGSCEL